MIRDRGTERGSGTMLVVGMMAVLMMAAGAAIIIGGYGIVAHRVKTAADLSALAGAQAISAGQDGCAAAQATAEANGASVVACEMTGDPVDFVLQVRAAAPVQAPMPGLPTKIIMEAFAGPVRT